MAQKAALVFVHPQGSYQPFNPRDEISQGLRRLLFAYPGSISPAKDAKTDFVPLIELMPNAGTLDWDELTFIPDDPTFPGQKMISEITGNSLVAINANPTLRTRDQTLTIAAHITGKPNSSAKDADGKGGAAKSAAAAASINVVFIADTDFLSEIIPYQQKSLEEPLDNVKLMQNALEVLAGDSEFVRLRNRQHNPPSLTRFEVLVEKYRLERINKQKAKEAEIREKLDEEQAKLDKATKKIATKQGNGCGEPSPGTDESIDRGTAAFRRSTPTAGTRKGTGNQQAQR